ncbi:MAG TPA: tetratricopeptide repeat protein [Lacunisphaera sp.]|nr:tetratricopeptide repeat protein [Lacunisphaera sp.]
MSKPANSPAPSSSFWLPFILSGVFGMLLGATLTYLALRPDLQRAATARAAASSSTTTLPADTTTHEPAPELTAGQPPAQAERTLGNFYYDHQNWSQAVAHYESAIRQGSDDADIRTDLGNAYRFAGRPQDALIQYELAQKMNPNHEFSLFNQGGLYLEDLKEPAKAVEAWQKYLQRFPNGQNVAAARQLIAQAQGGAAGLGQPPSPGAEKLILDRLKASPPASGKP